MFDLRQVIGRNRDLDGACRGEVPLAANAQEFAGSEVERGDTDVRRLLSGEPGKLRLQRL
ncbi:MAG TPA: hypothetical protein VGW38_18580 [Chloroflexota bacterium]|nr:hypothetical protein [Chloroflexota bacterium]